jgi:hypothetical protein
LTFLPIQGCKLQVTCPLMFICASNCMYNLLIPLQWYMSNYSHVRYIFHHPKHIVPSIECMCMLLYCNRLARD